MADFDFMGAQASYVPGLDPEEDLRRQLLAQSTPVTALPRATGRVKKQSVGGTLSTNRVPGDGVPSDAQGKADYFTAKGLEAYAAEPDVTGLQNYARQRAQEGDSAALLAMASNYAGKNFAPMQEVYLKRAMAAQEPLKVGNSGYITSSGEYIKDPSAAQDRQAQQYLSLGSVYSGQAQREREAGERAATLLAIQGMKGDSSNGANDARLWRAEDTLRHDFDALTKDDRSTLSETNKILNVLRQGHTTGIDQQSVAILLQKFLDPTSVVREAEYARAGEAQGLVGRVQSIIQSAQNGQFLTPKTQADIARLAELYSDAATRKMRKLAGQFAKIANTRGLDVTAIITDPSLLAPDMPAAAAPAAQTYNGLPVVNLPSPRR